MHQEFRAAEVKKTAQNQIQGQNSIAKTKLVLPKMELAITTIQNIASQELLANGCTFAVIVLRRITRLLHAQTGQND